MYLYPFLFLNLHINNYKVKSKMPERIVSTSIVFKKSSFIVLV